MLAHRFYPSSKIRLQLRLRERETQAGTFLTVSSLRGSPRPQSQRSSQPAQFVDFPAGSGATLRDGAALAFGTSALGETSLDDRRTAPLEPVLQQR